MKNTLGVKTTIETLDITSETITSYNWTNAPLPSGAYRIGGTVKYPVEVPTPGFEEVTAYAPRLAHRCRPDRADHDPGQPRCVARRRHSPTRLPGRRRQDRHDFTFFYENTSTSVKTTIATVPITGSGLASYTWSHSH
ncbi:MAG: hypothetical protein QM765_44505 [Myxococcales bacterium]